MDSVRVHNDEIELEIDPAAGGIRSLRLKTAELELVTEPRLVESFRLLFPTPETEANYAVGGLQRPATVAIESNRVELTWDGIDATCGYLDVRVRLSFVLTSGGVETALAIANDSPFPVAEAWVPILGGLSGVGPRSETRTVMPIAGWAGDEGLLQNFRGSGSELGTRGPEYLFKYPGELSMQWMALENRARNAGLYIGCHDRVARFKALRLSLAPGIGHLRDDPWPRLDDLGGGEPIGLRLSWVFFPYTPPSATFESPPTLISPYTPESDYPGAIYRKWFTTHFPLSDHRKDDYRATPAIQDTMFLLPEGQVTRRFNEMEAWAGAAAACGVRAVMLSGWDRGGHDNQYPIYEPDPRLGSWAELEDGIRACHALGVRVYFFINLQPIDCDTDWYREELHELRAMDPWGASTPMGWGMATVGARLGATRRPMVFATPSSPRLREIVVSQARRLAEIGADGVHVDKLAWSTVLLDFNPALEAPPDVAPWDGILMFLEELLRVTREVNPRFAVSVEGPWDRLLTYATVAWAWHSTWEDDHVDIFKEVFPEWLPTLAVTQPYDYNAVNNAVRFGYQMLIGPARYTGDLADLDMRPLSIYIHNVLQLVDPLKEHLLFGERAASDSVDVVAAGRVYATSHRNPREDSLACVVVNLGDQPAEVEASFRDWAGKVDVHRPGERPARVVQPVQIVLPPERIAVLVQATPDRADPAQT